MYMTKKIAYRRKAFTLVEMLVVIAIILALAALAAAFAPRVNDNQKMSRAVDNLQQWLLTAKMRAKRDGLATGIRFVPVPGDTPGVTYSQVQYIQQPEPLTGGVYMGGPPQPLLLGNYAYTNPNNGVVSYYKGGLLASAAGGTVTFQGVDFTLGQFPGSSLWNQWLVQPGDYLEVNGGGVYLIGGYSATSPQTTLLLGVPNPMPPLPPPALPIASIPSLNYDSLLNINTSALNATPTTNYRIIRQPRLLIGEEPLSLPNNYSVTVSAAVSFLSAFGVPDAAVPPNPTCNVLPGASGYPEILFAPSGAIIGTNAAIPLIWISVWDTTMEYSDANRVGIVGIQSRSGFIGAYAISLSGNPLALVQSARESGL